MASAAEQQPPESVPPQKRASGAEIAPLAAHDMQRDGAAAEVIACSALRPAPTDCCAA